MPLKKFFSLFSLKQKQKTILSRLFPRIQELLCGPDQSLKKVRLTLKKIYILPTKHGLLLALLLLGMLLGSVNYNNNIGYVVSFFLGSCTVLAMIYTVQHLAGLEFLAGKSLSSFAGKQAYFSIICYEKNGFERQNINIAISQNRQSLWIAPYSRQEIALSCPAPKRGRLALETIIVSTTYPFGIFRAWAYLKLDQETIVFPRPIPETIGLFDFEPAEQGSNPFGRKIKDSDELNGLRAYQPGESFRRIVWKIYARGKGLWSKEFALNQEQGPIWLDWSLLAPTDLETKLSIFCRLVLIASERDQVYGLRLPTLTIPPGQGNNHKNQCLTALALF